MSSNAGRLKIIDSHVHLWDPAIQDLPWLANLPALQHQYTIQDLEAAYAEFDAADTQEYTLRSMRPIMNSKIA